MAVSKEKILATKPPREAVQWLDGDVVYVSAMSGRARDAFELEQVSLTDGGNDFSHLSNVRARLLVKCLVDEDGNRLFEDSDAESLGEVWCAPLDAAMEVAKRLNAYTQADLEELEKNSASATS